MQLLAIETATESCSVALWREGEVILRSERAAARQHAALLLVQVEDVLAEAGLQAGALDFIAVGRGPGAFTGVRLGVGVAQGLAFSLDRPVITVSTLAALAQAGFASGAEEVLAVLDARMGEVYWALFRSFDGEHYFSSSGEQLTAVEQLIVPWTADRRLALGPGLNAIPDVQARLGLDATQILTDVLPDASQIAHLAAKAAKAGGGIRPEEAQPVYLRNRVADPPPPSGIDSHGSGPPGKRKSPATDGHG